MMSFFASFGLYFVSRFFPDALIDHGLLAFRYMEVWGCLARAWFDLFRVIPTGMYNMPPALRFSSFPFFSFVPLLPSLPFPFPYETPGLLFLRVHCSDPLSRKSVIMMHLMNPPFSYPFITYLVLVLVLVLLWIYL